MKKLGFVLAVIFVGITCSAEVVMGVELKEESSKSSELRIGIFDSRAISLAYYNSDMFFDKMNKIKNKHKDAKEAGNEQLLKELEGQGISEQRLAHMQTFSTASVVDILQNIKDKFPEIAKQAKVNLIVSKWNIAYEENSDGFVDVTELLVKQFNPSERTLNIMKQMKDQKPMKLIEILTIDPEEH